MNLQHFEDLYLFGDIDSRRGVGWVLTAMDGNVICDIDWDKSELRNMKNQNFEISKCWSDVSECWNR